MESKPEDYKCRICNERIARNIAVVVYKTDPEDYSFSHENLVCDDNDCIRTMSYCLAGEHHNRDRSVRIHQLRFDSLKFLPIPERKRLEEIIINAVSSASSQTPLPEQTPRDKSTDLGPIQGNLFHTP